MRTTPSVEWETHLVIARVPPYLRGVLISEGGGGIIRTPFVIAVHTNRIHIGHMIYEVSPPDINSNLGGGEGGSAHTQLKIWPQGSNITFALGEAFLKTLQ